MRLCGGVCLCSLVRPVTCSTLQVHASVFAKRQIKSRQHWRHITKFVYTLHPLYTQSHYVLRRFFNFSALTIFYYTKLWRKLADSVRWKSLRHFKIVYTNKPKWAKGSELKLCNYASNDIINSWMDHTKPLGNDVAVVVVWCRIWWSHFHILISLSFFFFSTPFKQWPGPVSFNCVFVYSLTICADKAIRQCKWQQTHTQKEYNQESNLPFMKMNV